MLPFDEAPLAYGLTRGMARALGLDLVAMVAEGWITRQDLARLVDACQACGRTGPCLAWLAASPQAAHLPDFCPNKPGLEALRP